jgi:Ca2+-binding EF-hand superfamily protein
VDVNEMGYFLEQLCVVEENTSRKIFQFIDRDGKGFFESIDLARTLNEIQEQCEVNEIDDLMELEKMYPRIIFILQILRGM